LLLDLARKYYRLEWQQDVPYGDRRESYVTRVSTETFDGKAYQHLAHKEVNHITEGSDLSIAKGNLAQARIDAHLLPLFFAHGIVESVHAQLRPDQMPTTYDADDFEMRNSQSFHGRNCKVVRTEPVSGEKGSFDEYLIDPAQRSAIHRHIIFVGSNPTVRTDVDWKESELGWWPEKWTHTWTFNNGKVSTIARLKLERIELNPIVSESDFTLEVLPGMTVDVLEVPAAGTGLNPNYPARTTYRISSSGSWEELSAKGFTTLEGKLLPAERRLGWGWVVAACGGAAAALLAYALFRRIGKTANAERLTK